MLIYFLRILSVFTFLCNFLVYNAYHIPKENANKVDDEYYNYTKETNIVPLTTFVIMIGGICILIVYKLRKKKKEEKEWVKKIREKGMYPVYEGNIICKEKTQERWIQKHVNSIQKSKFAS